MAHPADSAHPGAAAASWARSVAGRPWDDPHGMDELATVHEHMGRQHHTDLLWIPGVVLAPVDAAEQIDHAYNDLVDALGPVGNAYGVLFLGPTLRWAQAPDARALARARVRIESAAPMTPAHGQVSTAKAVDRAARVWLAQLGRASIERLQAHHRPKAGRQLLPAD